MDTSTGEIISEDEAKERMANGSQTLRPLSYGEQAVGLAFNPGGNPAVDNVKKLYAAIIDQCNEERAKLGPNDGEKKRLFSVAITEAQTAQMWAVKAITWK